MTTAELHDLARRFAGYDASEDTVNGFITGFEAACERINSLNDGGRATFYVYDTQDYSSQRLVEDIMLELHD